MQMSSANSHTFAIYTLGCRVNQYDSWWIAEQLKEMGMDERPFGEPADVYIVNTCTVTHVADHKSRKALSKARRLSPDALVIAIGCGVDLSQRVDSKGFDSADIILNNRDKQRLPAILKERLGLSVQGQTLEHGGHRKQMIMDDTTSHRVRINLKVQDGCDRFCAFCVVPYTRGAPRSRPPNEVLCEARKLIARGYREIVLTGVCLGDYGRDLNGGSDSNYDLATLIEQLCELDGLVRIRLSSLDPRDVSERLIKVAEQSTKVCRHFHISLQSGDDEMLKAMARGYTIRDYEAIVDAVRSAMPEAAITTDVLVGFPGETQQQFENTVRFVERMKFAKLHVFKFSPRPLTKAARLPGHLPCGEVERRCHIMLELGRNLARAFAERFVGCKMDVLLERAGGDCNGKFAEGLTTNYLRVRIHNEPLEVGSLVTTRLHAITNEGVIIGELR